MVTRTPFPSLLSISISPLLRELIIELSDQVADDGGREDLLTRVLLRELPRMAVQRLHLPLSPEPRLKRIYFWLAEERSPMWNLGAGR